MKANKPVKPVRLSSATKEEQEMHIARFLANKKETFFELILANILRAGFDGKITEAVDLAVEGADHAIVKLYPVEKKED